MHKPVDGAEARAAETAAYRLLCARLQRNFETAEASDTCTLRAAVKAMLAHSAALVAENERLREELNKIAFLSTNHGGWFESDPFGEYRQLGDIARTALETRNG